MTTTINGSSPSITFSDATTQTTAFTTGAVTQATMGTNVAGTGPAFSAYASAATSTASATFTKVAINTKEFDTNTNFDNVTNYRFTPTVAGYYQVSSAITWAASATGYGLASIFKNGAEFKRGSSVLLSAGLNVAPNVSALIYLNGSTDYIELYVYQNSGATLSTFNGSVYVYFQACLVRGA
jgi:hypothetical protein